MDLQNLRNTTRYYTRSTSLDFTDADLDRILNEAYSEIINLIVGISGNYHLMENKATTDLIANATSGSIGYNGHYCFPTDLLKPLKIELSFDGSTYKKANFYDMTQGVEEDMDAGTTSAPVVRFSRTQLVIRPLPTTNVTDGLVIWYEQRQGDLENNTDEPKFEKNFHQLLVYKACIAYSLRFAEKYNELWDKKVYGLTKDLEKHYRNMYKTTKVVTPNYDDFSI